MPSKSPIQQMFEDIAQDIMKRGKSRLANTSTPQFRVDIIKEMNAELQELKKTYAGMLDEPVVNSPFSEVLSLDVK